MKRLASKAAFTLVETIVTMVMFIILVAGFASVFAFTSVTTYHAGRNGITNAEARTETDKVLVGDILANADLDPVSVTITFNGAVDSDVRTYNNVTRGTVTESSGVSYSPDVRYIVYMK